MKLRDRARSLFKRELSEHTVRASKVDHAVLNDIRKRAPAIDEMIRQPPAFPSGDGVSAKVWERMTEDLWSEFYGDDEPSMLAREKIGEPFRVNREIADKQARDESFRETRSMTRGEKLESAVALRGALGSLAKSYEEELAEHGERANEIADAQDELDGIDEMLEELRFERRENGDSSYLGPVEKIDTQIRDLAQQKRKAVGRLRAAEQAQALHAGDLIDAAKKAVARAAQAAEDAVETASLLPGKGGGNGKRVSPDVMLQFADRVHGSAVLRKVLEMMGRLELSMGSKRATLRKGGFEEMVDIELGDELRLVLPMERALLSHPIGRLDFYRRFHERSLMQYEMWSEQELKRGPIIFAADGSGSMSGAPNIFCRGLTLASCSIGNHEGRNTCAIEFGSEGQLREFFFPAGRPIDTEVALDFAEHFFHGGTDINQVLVRAKELIDNEAPFHTADLVIVTDGGDVLTEETFTLRDGLRSMGVKIHGIVVGIRPTQYMIEVCDHVSSVFDFAGPNSTSDRIAIDLS